MNDPRGTLGSGHPVAHLWLDVEASREEFWQHNPVEISARLRRRAFLAARSLPILPGRRVLEVGAGSGLWTEHLAAVLGGGNPITAAVFNQELVSKAQLRGLPDAHFVHVNDFQEAFPQESFDYIVGMDIVTDVLSPSMLDMAHRYLRPGGQVVFFARNGSHPFTVLRKSLGRVLGRGHAADVGRSVDQEELGDAAVRKGFTGIEVTYSEVIRPLRSSAGQAIGLILERAPMVRRFSKIGSFHAAKPASGLHTDGPEINLATRPELFDAVSVVVPCHNEEENVDRLVRTMLGLYRNYIHEIVIVDDSSTDETSQVTAAIASTEPRVKLVRRNPPGGVGRALRDGYAAASGRYILSIDCDFIFIAPEFKKLFDAIADGYDGAIGSRFSSESALVHYPFLKILCNRGYHLILNLVLGKRIRDISNNLKLYRAEILKSLEIEADGFAANVETGLKPILLNYQILEVPTSWINRTPDMGKSSFNLLRTGPEYVGVLFRTLWKYWRGQYRALR